MKHYLTEQQLDFLLYIRDGLTLQEIARRMDRSVAYIQQLFGDMEAKGFVKRERYVHQGRSLTKEGKEALIERGHPID